MVTQTTQSTRHPVSLRALAAAITRVQSLREIEHTCEVSGVQLTLRPLRPDQETEVQGYVQVAWDTWSGKSDQAAYADFMDRLRTATISYALVQIDELDLRDVEYLETEEVDDNGNKISLPKVDALRTMISSEWTRTMLTLVFAQFGELLSKLDAKASNAVVYDPIDLEAEIERLERRLTDLRNQKEKSAVAQVDVVQQGQKAVLATQQGEPREKTEASTPADALASEVLRTHEQRAAGTVEVPRKTAPQPQAAQPQAAQPQAAQPQAAQPQAAQPQARQPSTPPSASPPQRSAPEQPRLAIDDEAPPMRSALEIEFDANGQSMPLGGDSFFDPSDPDAAVEIEMRRHAAIQRELRERKAQQEEESRLRDERGEPDPREAARDLLRGTQRNSGPPPGVRADPRMSGLRAAANTSNQVLDGGAGQIRSGRPEVPLPTPSSSTPTRFRGKEVHRMPTQELDRPAREHSPVVPAIVNPPLGSANPHFRRPKSSL